MFPLPGQFKKKKKNSCVGNFNEMLLLALTISAFYGRVIDATLAQRELMFSHESSLVIMILI